MTVDTVRFLISDPRPQAQLDAPQFHEWVTSEEVPWTRFYRNKENYLLRFPELADFELSADGRMVRCWPMPDISGDTIQHLYLNQVLPLALSKLGKLVLHASAVDIDDGAVAFVGESGRGKSTLAASFATNGARFLTDDGLVLEMVGGAYRAMPSHPSLRLWEDSEDSLLGEHARKAPALPFTPKSRFFAGEHIAFCNRPLPLRRVYFLGDGTRPDAAFERISPSEALIELVRHSFLLDIEERRMLAAQFDELTEMVKQPMFFRLDYPRRYDDLARVRQAIVDHVREEDQAA